jgi:hypothetical protein
VKDASRDPQMDSSQDYRLLLGYENKTHTVLRFSRRYDTCDPRDLKITVGDAIYATRDDFSAERTKRARDLRAAIFARTNALASLAEERQQCSCDIYLAMKLSRTDLS